MKKLSHYIKIDELIFDVTIGIMTLVFYYIVPENKLVSPRFSPVLAIILFFMVFLVPWYLGSIYERINTHRKKSNSTFYRILAVSTVFAGLGVSLIVAFVLPLYLGTIISEDIFFSLFIINLLTGTIGVTLGWLFGIEFERSFNAADKLKEGFFTYFATLLSSSSFVAVGFIIIMLVEASEESFNWIVAASVLVLTAYLMVKNKINEILHSRIFRFYVFPFIICFLCMLALDITHEVFIDRTEDISILNIIKVMTFSGILPIRLILLFAPPFKIINFSIGLVSLGFYIVSAAGII